MSLNLAPKRTARHIYCNSFMRMRVCLVAEVSSHTVAARINTYAELGALSEDAKYTTNFLNEIDSLFDTFNSNHISHYKSNRCVFSSDNGQLKNLKHSEIWLNSFEVSGKSTFISCIAGWQINVKSLHLWQDVNINNNF